MKSIRGKFMWLLVVSLLVSSVIIGGVGTVLTFNVVAQNSNENMNLLCKTKADKLDMVFAKVEDSVNTLVHYAQAESLSVDSFLQESERATFIQQVSNSALHHIESTEGAKAVYMHLDPTRIGYSDGFFFVKNETTGVFEPRTLTNVLSYAPTDTAHVGFWYTPVNRGEATWLESYYDIGMDYHVISYVVPFYKDGQLVGIIGADISTEYVADQVKDIAVYETGKAAILKSNGTVVYHPNFERDAVIGAGDPGFDGVVDKLAQGDRTDVLVSYELGGVEKKLASCKLRNDMLLICFAPASEIYKEQNHFMFFTVLVTALVVLTASLIAALICQALVRPLKQLNEATQHLTDEDYDFNIKTNNRDEIGQLTNTFVKTREILMHQFYLLDTEAHRDGLTGVGNKSAFMDREKELNAAILDGAAAFAVAVLDVNRLKITNDVFGHMAGDKMLSTLAGYLADNFGIEDVYRVGGDEFVVILTGDACDSGYERMDACVAGMRRLEVEGYPDCGVSCAYGVSRFDPRQDHQFSDVLRRADKKMYVNKTVTKQETFPWQEGIKGIKQLQMEKYGQLLQTLTASTDDFLFLMNTETGTIRFFGQDPNFFDIADGRELSNGVMDMLHYVHVNDHALIKNTVSAVLNHDIEQIDIWFRMHTDNRQMCWVSCRGGVIKDENDSHFVVIGRISQNAVKHLYNPVTTLFNKTKLIADLQASNSSIYTCLMLLDIDNLSEINLKHGSAYGDSLLRMMAEELECRFSTNQIYHTEKDRFVVMLDAASRSEAERIFEEIKAALAAKCSISASLVPNERSMYVNVENSYDYAVRLLSNVKKTSGGQIVFFSEEDLQESISAVELLEDLEQCVSDDCRGFRLMYQPQLSAGDYSLVSAEALLRFDSVSKGTVPPDTFIPVLEQVGLIHQVGVWVLDEALRQCKEWRRRFPAFRVSVNVSPKQLSKKQFATQVLDLLARHDLPGDALILEITESAQLNANESIFAILDKLKQNGVLLALDDFGSGYSNLSNLKQIHADILKIDRMFIRDIQENGYQYSLIRNVIEFSKSHAVRVCLEGVETAKELLVLSGLQADMYQGYLFDGPCEPAVLEERYFDADTDAFAQRDRHIALLRTETRHAPIVNMEMKTILKGAHIGLWIIRLNAQTGEGELYADETMCRLLGVDDTIAPGDCYRHWQECVCSEYRQTVETMVAEMIAGDEVVQAEYAWFHPQDGQMRARSTGRCVERSDEGFTFEGFHRILRQEEKRE